MLDNSIYLNPVSLEKQKDGEVSSLHTDSNVSIQISPRASFWQVDAEGPFEFEREIFSVKNAKKRQSRSMMQRRGTMIVTGPKPLFAQKDIQEGHKTLKNFEEDDMRVMAAFGEGMITPAAVEKMVGKARESVK